MARMPSLADAFLMVRIAALVMIVPFVARKPVRQLHAFLEPSGPLPKVDALQIARIIRYTDRLCKVGQGLIRSHCMARGLTLYFFLRRAGVIVSLAFGVGSIDDNFVGHCWLVQNGEPYLEVKDPRGLFTPVFILNGPSIAVATAQ